MSILTSHPTESIPTQDIDISQAIGGLKNLRSDDTIGLSPEQIIHNKEWLLDDLTFKIMLNRLQKAGYMPINDFNLAGLDYLLANFRVAPMFAEIRALIVAGVE